MAAVAYVLTWVTGLIIYFTSKPQDKYQRWHAIQAIGYGIATTVVYFVLTALPGLWMLGSLLWLLIIVGVVILAVKAYQGEKLRLPVIADFADKNA